MNKQTVVFFPLETGIAHIVRSLAIAEELQKRGYKIIFCLPRRKHSLFKNTPVKFTDIKGYSHVDSMETLEKVRDPDFLLSQTNSELKILQTYKPDFAVIDYRISALVSCKSLKIPMAFITNTTGLPYQTYLPNFFHFNSSFFGLFNKIFIPFINYVKTQLLLKPLNEASNKLTKLPFNFKKEVSFIVPESVNYLPLLERAQNVGYVEHIVWNGFKVYSPPWIKKIKPELKTVYLTFGGTGFDKQRLISLSNDLLKLGYQVIVSYSTIVSADDFKIHENLFLANFISLPLIAKHIDLIVCHGGYGTLIEAIQMGIPFISIPFNPDQWLHATRFEELGYGKSIVEKPWKFLVSAVNFKWTKMEQMTKSIDTKNVIKVVQEVLSNPQFYRKNRNKVPIGGKNGNIKSANYIESMIKNKQ